MLMYRAKIAGNLDEMLEAVDNRYALLHFKKNLEMFVIHIKKS
jgi:hypothetical protein